MTYLLCFFMNWFHNSWILVQRPQNTEGLKFESHLVSTFFSAHVQTIFLRTHNDLKCKFVKSELRFRSLCIQTWEASQHYTMRVQNGLPMSVENGNIGNLAKKIVFSSLLLFRGHLVILLTHYYHFPKSFHARLFYSPPLISKIQWYNSSPIIDKCY